MGVALFPVSSRVSGIDWRWCPFFAAFFSHLRIKYDVFWCSYSVHIVVMTSVHVNTWLSGCFRFTVSGVTCMRCLFIDASFEPFPAGIRRSMVALCGVECVQHWTTCKLDWCRAVSGFESGERYRLKVVPVFLLYNLWHFRFNFDDSSYLFSTFYPNFGEKRVSRYPMSNPLPTIFSSKTMVNRSISNFALLCRACNITLRIITIIIADSSSLR